VSARAGSTADEPGDRAVDAKARMRVQAPASRRRLTVVGRQELGPYRVLRLADPDGPVPQPGQFAMLAAVQEWGGGADERPYLPRAFSIARWRGGEADYLLEDVGPGTHRLCELQAGEEVWVLGPLGNGFALPDSGRRAILVGGGVGIAPLAILQDVLAQRQPTTDPSPNDSSTTPAEPSTTPADSSTTPAEPSTTPADSSTTPAEPSTTPADSSTTPAEPSTTPANPSTDDGFTVLLGFRDGARAEGAALLDGARVATDDGSVGHDGLVTDLLAEELDRGDAGAGAGQQPPTVYACGPAPMLEAVRALCTARQVPAQLALESGMACGFGACFGCVVPRRGGGYLRVCLDGPVIDAAMLDSVDAHAGAPA
jgi:NAD(P)H-flavin reductase